MWICIVFLLINPVRAQIEWQTAPDGVIWAQACDFPTNAFTSASRSDSGDCGRVCMETNACTHFAWTIHQNGTCWLKWGYITQQNAVYNENYEMVCGLIPSIQYFFKLSMFTPPPPPSPNIKNRADFVLWV